MIFGLLRNHRADTPTHLGPPGRVLRTDSVEGEPERRCGGAESSTSSRPQDRRGDAWSCLATPASQPFTESVCSSFLIWRFEVSR